MRLDKMTNSEIAKEIQKPIESFDIREMILDSAVPFEWCRGDYSHPIQSLGYFYFGIADGFTFDVDKVNKADEALLWKLYGLITTYWLVHFQNWARSKPSSN